MGLQFHFRNFDSNDQWFGVYHAGGALAPWHDGRPGVWKQTIPHNPLGGGDAVYVPSDFVVNFGAWFDVIIDGLTLVKDFGIFLATEGADEEELVEVIKDIFEVEKDVIIAAAKKRELNLGKLAKRSHESLQKAARAVELEAQDIKDLAKKMGLKKHWAFIAGDTYQKKIHDDSDVVNGYGWSIFTSGVKDSSTLRIANHAFLESGHLIQFYSQEMHHKLWKKNW
jgi:hypothetical protein